MLAWVHTPTLGLCVGADLEPPSCPTPGHAPSGPTSHVHPGPGPPLQAEWPGQYRIGSRRQGSPGGRPSPTRSPSLWN